MKTIITMLSGMLMLALGNFSNAQACQASFTYTQNGTTVDFTNTSTSDSSTASQWSWDFGDNNTSPNNDPTHTYAQPGTYTVCLFIVDWNCQQNPTLAYCDTIIVTAGRG